MTDDWPKGGVIENVKIIIKRNRMGYIKTSISEKQPKQFEMFRKCAERILDFLDIYIIIITVNEGKRMNNKNKNELPDEDLPSRTSVVRSLSYHDYIILLILKLYNVQGKQHKKIRQL